MADRARSGQVRRRQIDLATRRAGTGPALRARQLQIRNPVLRGLARAAGIRTRDQAWRIGAAGEVKVGARLNRLRRHGWRVLHSIPLGRGGDIDHLIIGPGGVFTANTKHHPNARVNVGNQVVCPRRRRHRSRGPPAWPWSADGAWPVGLRLPIANGPIMPEPAAR